MKQFSKNIILSLSLIFLLSSCNKSDTIMKQTFTGMVQGSYFNIIFFSNAKEYESSLLAIDSIFKAIDSSVSLWNKSSIINKVNNNEEVVLDSVFIELFTQSQEVSALTDGAFDITIGSLVEKYGFAAKKKQPLTKEDIDSLMRAVGYKTIRIENSRLIKDNPNTKLDFNAIAQGYTADKVAEYFLSKGIENFIIDIGGEINARGKKEKGKLWRCAIEQPADSSTADRKYNTYIDLDNACLATSGNYRKYYIDKDGTKKSHTIDTKTGRSVSHNLLSVTVKAKTATKADALATAFMVMGLEKAKTFLAQHPNIQAHFIFSTEKNAFQTHSCKDLNIKQID